MGIGCRRDDKTQTHSDNDRNSADKQLQRNGQCVSVYVCVSNTIKNAGKDYVTVD